GTKAIEDKQFLKTVIEDFKNKTILSLDYGKDGLIFKDGWQKGTEIKLFDFAKELEVLGVKEIIITDISRDGTLKGSNFKFIKKLLENLSLEIIVAGGISTIGDITNIKKLEKKGIKGIIIGKALYEGKIDLKKAIKIGIGQ
ncbi:MAG: tRNA-dihydrouridine synthase, partial [Actinobacteria bacterium]|nr:tRNA-dihydrouridine synthase [Actinomycetota bacterium]